MGTGRDVLACGRRLALVGVLAALLTACGGGEAAEPTPPATTMATPPPTPLATNVPLSLSDVVWATAVDPSTNEPVDDVGQFPNDAPVIIAAVAVEDIPAGTVLTASWAIDGVDVPEATMTVTTESTLTSGWATFRFTREEGHLFPLGDLQVTVSAPDGTTASGDVEIVLPGG